MKPGKSAPWLRLAAALASGAGTALLIPPFHGGGLVWVVMLPLLVALWSLNGRTGRKGFWLGWLAGVTGFLISLHWLTVVSPVGWVALSCYLAVFPGLWGMFAAKWANPWRKQPVKEESPVERKIREKAETKSAHWRQSMVSLRTAFAVAAVWCGLEWLRGWLFTGFGWNSIGVAFHETPVMAQSADLLGICGLSFLPVFLQAVIVQTGRRLIAESKAGRIRPHVDFGVAAVMVALAFCYGVWRLSTEGKGESVKLEALLVQLDIPQEAARRLWTTEQIHFGYEEETLKGLKAVDDANEQRLLEAKDGETVELKRPDWIVWPESSLDGKVLRSDDGQWAAWDQVLETLSIVRAEGDFTMIFGLLEDEGEWIDGQPVPAENGKVWNSLVVLEPDDRMKTFRKHHLVIFGEYIPLVEKLPFLRKIYEQQAGVDFGGSIAVGQSLEPVPTVVDGEKVGIIPTVCFEDTVPRLLRNFLRGGPQVIVNVTNDGWFKDSPAAAQHFANSRFRAIELRRPMLRCANTGVSAAVDTVGSTVNRETGEKQELRDENGNHLTRGSLLVDVAIPKKPSLSLYAVIGDWGVIVLGVIGLLVGIIGARASCNEGPEGDGRA